MKINSNTPAACYTRGNDLSGTMEGAGGIGGMLARSHGYSSGNWSTHNYYHADGNGNITYMLNSSQSKVAEYRYDPFGNTISSSGTLAAANLYRFSSKEIHLNSGLYCYLYRFYDPNLQRWINRDPIEESGGINLYAYVKNSPVAWIDPVGLWEQGMPCTFMCPCTVTCNLVSSPFTSRRIGKWILIDSVTDNYSCTDCHGRPSQETRHRIVIIYTGPGPVRVIGRSAVPTYSYDYFEPCFTSEIPF